MAQEFWHKPNKKWTMAEAIRLDTVDVMKMTVPERAELAEFLRQNYQRRVQQFERAGLKSFAFVKLEDDIDFVRRSDKIRGTIWNTTNNYFTEPVLRRVGNGETQLNDTWAYLKRPANSLASYIVTLQDFFNAKSSTVSGWKKISAEQDARLFGTTTKRRKRVLNSDGKTYHYEYVDTYANPQRRMTDDERTRFWRLMRQYKDSAWDKEHGYSSESQRELAAYVMEGRISLEGDLEEAEVRLYNLINGLPETVPVIVGEPGNPTQLGPEFDWDEGVFKYR